MKEDKVKKKNLVVKTDKSYVYTNTSEDSGGTKMPVRRIM